MPSRSGSVLSKLVIQSVRWMQDWEAACTVVLHILLKINVSECWIGKNNVSRWNSIMLNIHVGAHYSAQVSTCPFLRDDSLSVCSWYLWWLIKPSQATIMNPIWIDTVYFGMLSSSPRTLNAPLVLVQHTPRTHTSHLHTPRLPKLHLHWRYKAVRSGEVVVSCFWAPVCETSKPSLSHGLSFVFWFRIAVSLFYPPLMPSSSFPFSNNSHPSPSPLRPVQYVCVPIRHCLSACLPLTLVCCVLAWVLFCSALSLVAVFLSCLSVSKSALPFSSSFYYFHICSFLLSPLNFFASQQTLWRWTAVDTQVWNRVTLMDLIFNIGN